MAKATKAAVVGAGAARCTCNYGYMIVALILLTIGLYLIVAGFAWQFNSASRLGDGAAGMVLAAYFIGMLIVVFGKMAKWKAHGDCKVHGGK